MVTPLPCLYCGVKMAVVNDSNSYNLHPRLVVPHDLPILLRNFTKAAIKTQPPDLLIWSAEYFKCLVCAEPLPVKERVEWAIEGEKKPTLGLLRLLNTQLKKNEYVSVIELKRKSGISGINSEFIDEVLNFGGFKNRIRWEQFLALICYLTTKDSVKAVALFCEVLTEEEEGGPALIPYKKFLKALNTVLGPKIKDGKWKDCIAHMAKCSKLQGGMVHPGNLRTIKN